MQYGELIEFLENVGKDPSRLIFEDELTGIHNRRFLLSYLEHKVRWDSYDDFPLALLVIDLDQFKEVNDAHGHDTGDQVLIWMATTLQEIIGDQGMPIRFGGDEFAVLLPRTGQTRAREMAARILQRTRDRTFRLRESGATLPITLSIGVASAPTDATSSR
ncbi:MAG: GGDEF domain-containing protein, partial [Gemmatimonadota bacterium]